MQIYLGRWGYWLFILSSFLVVLFCRRNLQCSNTIFLKNVEHLALLHNLLSIENLFISLLQILHLIDLSCIIYLFSRKNDGILTKIPIQHVSGIELTNSLLYNIADTCNKLLFW
jgi:hypothetical protein